MKSRYLILVPLILLVITLVPVMILRNKTEKLISKTQDKTPPPALEIPTYTTAPPSPGGIGGMSMHSGWPAG